MKHAPLCLCAQCTEVPIAHTVECEKFWDDAALMQEIGERWDHWTQPNCPACDERRRLKGIK